MTYHSVDSDEIFGTLGPLWQQHRIHQGTVLLFPKVIAVTVRKHLRERIKLGDNFLKGKKFDSVSWSYLNQFMPLCSYQLDDSILNLRVVE